MSLHFLSDCRESRSSDGLLAMQSGRHHAGFSGRPSTAHYRQVYRAAAARGSRQRDCSVHSARALSHTHSLVWSPKLLTHKHVNTKLAL